MQGLVDRSHSATADFCDQLVFIYSVHTLRLVKLEAGQAPNRHLFGIPPPEDCGTFSSNLESNGSSPLVRSRIARLTEPSGGQLATPAIQTYVRLLAKAITLDLVRRRLAQWIQRRCCHSRQPGLPAQWPISSPRLPTRRAPANRATSIGGIRRRIPAVAHASEDRQHYQRLVHPRAGLPASETVELLSRTR